MCLRSARDAPECPKIWLRRLYPANKKLNTTKWVFQASDGQIWTRGFPGWVPTMWARAFACAWVRLDNVGACATELRENARAMFLAKPVGSSDCRIVGPVPGIFGVTQTCVFTMSSRAFLGFGARVFWGLARRRAHRRITAYVDAYRRISAHICTYWCVSAYIVP